MTTATATPKSGKKVKKAGKPGKTKSTKTDTSKLEEAQVWRSAKTGKSYRIVKVTGQNVVCNVRNGTRGRYKDETATLARTLFKRMELAS